MSKMGTLTRSFMFKLKMLHTSFVTGTDLASLTCGFRDKSIGSMKMFSTNIAPEQPPDERLEKMVSDISKGDSLIENKLRVLILELDVMRQDGRQAPELSFLKRKHWDSLLQLNSRNQRMKYITYLFKSSKSEENEKIKKDMRRLEAEKAKELKNQLPPLPITQNYGLLGNSMFLRIYEKSMNKLYNYKLLQAMIFGQKLVIDCSYDAYMSKKESLNAAKQLMNVFSENRFHLDPYDIHFCNVNKESIVYEQFLKFIPTMNEPDFPINLHTKSYLDLFPKRNIVYLTPHCKNELNFSFDDIYVIGCMVDKSNSQPYSLAKAKELGLRMAKLPLDNYLSWRGGSGKSLALNQVCSILLDMKLTNDWNYAFRHVPRRKLLPSGSISSSYENAVDKYLKSSKFESVKNPLQNSRSEIDFPKYFKRPSTRKVAYKKNVVTSLYED